MPSPSTSEERHAEMLGRLARVHARIAEAAADHGRDASSVRLLLATKGVDADTVRAAIREGGAPVGENRVQELAAKAPELIGTGRAGGTPPGPDSPAGLPEIHLIGHLQSNKVGQVLRWVSCVQSVDTLALAERLSQRCLALDRSLRVLVQVNVSGEVAKSGVAPADAVELACRVAALDRLELGGFMAVGANSPDADVVRSGYRELRRIRDEVLASGRVGTDGAHELSIGMSRDLELAVAEGATMVRVGSAVFGPRPRP